MRTRLCQSCLPPPSHVCINACSLRLQVLPQYSFTIVGPLQSSAKPPGLSACTTLELGQKSTINVFSSSNPGTIILMKYQLTNGRVYHEDDTAFLDPVGSCAKGLFWPGHGGATLRVRTAVQPCSRAAPLKENSHTARSQ